MTLRFRKCRRKVDESYGKTGKNHCREWNYLVELLLSGKLNEYLNEIDEECYEMLNQLVEQMKERRCDGAAEGGKSEALSRKNERYYGMCGGDRDAGGSVCVINKNNSLLAKKTIDK